MAPETDVLITKVESLASKTHALSLGCEKSTVHAGNVKKQELFLIERKSRPATARRVTSRRDLTSCCFRGLTIDRSEIIVKRS